MPMSYPSHYAAWHAFAGFFAFIWLFVLVAVVFTIVMYWRIFSKAGYNGALSLLTLVPLGSLVLLILLAFGEWPIEQELRRFRTGGPTPPMPGTSVTPAL